MGREQNIAVVAKYTEAINKRDAEGFVSVFGADSVWIDPMGYPACVGPEQILRGIQGFWDAFPSLTLTPLRIIADGDIVVTEVACDVADAQGKTAHIEAADVFEIRDGKIVNCHAYSDPAWISRQLADQ